MLEVINTKQIRSVLANILLEGKKKKGKKRINRFSKTLEDNRRRASLPRKV